MSKFIDYHGKLPVILGSQWGDEGKGKLIDIMSQDYDIIVRATGGANAGHTIYVPDPQNPGKSKKYVFHLVPSGMLHEKPICIIGNGVVVHLPTIFEELEILEKAGVVTKDRLLISDRAHLVFEYHSIIDGMQEEKKGSQKVGTTKRGIGPCYTDKISRHGIRVHELLNFQKFEAKYRANVETLNKIYGDLGYNHEEEITYCKNAIEKIKDSIINSAYYLNNALKEGKTILIEGANGALLDIDHGTYPYVTSSNATVGGVVTGTGIGARKLTHVIGIKKAYVTRVGAGPFPTELQDETGEKIREIGNEYGATTGRPRRCGWFDAVVSKYSVMINSFDSINLTKLDVLSGLETLKIATKYKYNSEPLNEFPADLDLLDKIEVEYIEMPGWNEDISKIRNFNELPENAKKYVEKIEELIECRISSIGVGKRREDLIYRF